MIYKMKIADSVDEMVFDLLEVPIEDKDIEGTADNTTIDGNVFTDYLWLKKQFTQKWSLMCKDDYTQLRGFYTRQWENAEVPTYKLYVGNDIRETKSASGNPLQITNSTEYDAPILDFKLNGNTEQTTYTGKNLVGLAHSPASAQITEGVTISSQTDEKLVIVSSNVQYACLRLFYQLPAGTYTASTKATSSDSYEPRITIYKAGVAIAQGVTPSSPRSFTLTEEATIDFRFFATTSTAAVRTVTFYDFQLEKSNQATAYEPYVGGIASPNPDYPQAVNVVSGEQVVKVNGQNLIELKPYRYGYYYGQSVGAEIAYDITTSASIVSFTANADGTSSVSSTASWRGVFLMSEALSVGTYYFNLDGASTTANQGATVYVLDSNHKITRQIINATGNPITDALKMSITLTGDERYISLGIGCRTTAGTVNLGTLMISVGSSPVPYEKYRVEDYKIYLPPDTLDNMFEQGSFNASGINDNANNRIRTKNYIPCEGSTQYKIYASTSKSGKTLQTSVSFYTTDDYSTARISFQNWIAVSGSGATITTPANAKYMRILLAFNDNTNIVPSDVYQVKLRSDIFTPIELCKIGTYQDYIWNDNGTWKVHKAVGKVVLNGTENWGDEHTYSRYYTQISDAINTLERSQIYSDYYHFVAQYGNEGAGFIYGAKCYLYWGTTSDDVSLFKTWLGTHNTTVYYILATPTDTAITESALITQLNAIVQASLPVGLNNVSNISIAPNLAGEMELSYELIHEKETIIRDTTPVRLTLTDGGVINPCECRQNVQITMRETTQ